MSHALRLTLLLFCAALLSATLGAKSDLPRLPCR